jgi:hypothetical protein
MVARQVDPRRAVCSSALMLAGKVNVRPHEDFVATVSGVQIGPDGDRSQMRFYHGLVESEFATPTALKHLGSEKLHPIVARGTLLDLAGASGVESMKKAASFISR